MGMITLHGGYLLDPRRPELLGGMELLIEGNTVKEVSDRPIAVPGSTRIDVRGGTIMPGLIDAHIHMYYVETTFAMLRTVPQSYAAAKASYNLRGMLMRGFTSVRDMGGGDYGMRDAASAGYVDTPRLFVSGRALTQTGGHGDFRDRPDSSNDWTCCSALGTFAVIADGVPDVIKASRDELRKGADHLKIMLSGGVASPNDPLDSLQYRTDEISAAVDEATRWGSYVGGHAYSDAAIRRAVECGVRTIEHGNFIEAETAAMMASRQAFIVPTLITYDIMKKRGAELGKSPENLRKNDVVHAAGFKSLETCRAAGVQIGYGSDLNMRVQPQQADGLALHREVMPAHEVIRSATLVNAQIVRQEGKLGELVPGAFADLLVVAGNPYDSLDCLQDDGAHMTAIMKDGRFYKNAL